MTDEVKDARAQADKIAATEGLTRIVDRWGQRADEQHESAIKTNDAIRRERERAILRMDEGSNFDKASEARAARYEEAHTAEWAMNKERHATYMGDVAHLMAARDRENAALERIAVALEKLAGK